MRSVVIAIAVACFAGGLLALATGVFPPAFIFAFWGGFILLGTVWERVRYKPVESLRPGPGWVATDERFVDDQTGKPIRVWLEPTTGERRYVTD